MADNDERLYPLNGVSLSGTTKSWAETLNNNFKEIDKRKLEFDALKEEVEEMPTPSDATITIQKNGANVDTFTLDQANDKTINITLAKGDVGLGNVDNVRQYSANNEPPYPVKGVTVNGTDVVNGTTKIAAVTVPTKVSDLTNDEGYTKVEASSANGKIKIDGTETTVYTLPADVLHTGDADPAGTATSAVSTHNSSGSAHNDIRTLVSTAQSTADTAKSIAEGRDKAQSYASYSAMVTALNAEASATAKVGDNVYVETVDVPDFWVSKVNSSKTTYTYTTDAAIISAIATNGYIDIGWYRLAQLESTKVDLSGYVPTSRKVAGKALTSDITLAAGDVGALADSTKYGKSLAVSGTSVSLKDQDGTVLSTITTQDTTYSNLPAASGGTDVSLVTTGDKYNWNSAVSGLANKMNKANPEGTGKFILNRKSGSSVSYGDYSFTAGYGNVAEGNYSAVFGIGNTASGNSSFAEGNGNTASGASSHAEGNMTVAGQASAHAEGFYTKANKISNHVFGEYNIEDTESNPFSRQIGTYRTSYGRYVEIVGNGTAENARSNARTLDWNGNEWIAGNMKVNKTTLANTASDDITVSLPPSAGTIATQEYVQSQIGSIDQKTILDFTATGWAEGSDGYFTKTIATTKYPINCFNNNNKVVMATLGVTKSGTAVTAITIESDEPFAGYVVAL